MGEKERPDRTFTGHKLAILLRSAADNDMREKSNISVRRVFFIIKMKIMRDFLNLQILLYQNTIEY